MESNLHDEQEKESLAGYVLFNVAPVLQNIFCWLNMKSLCRSVQVCKLWNELVKKEVKKRNPVGSGLVIIPTSIIKTARKVSFNLLCFGLVVIVLHNEECDKQK